MPSETSAVVNDALGGGTGMNGALHAQISDTTPRTTASRAMRRRRPFIEGETPAGRGTARPAPPKQAEKSGSCRPDRQPGWRTKQPRWSGGGRWSCEGESREPIALELLLQAESRQAEELGRLRLVVPAATERLAQEPPLEPFDARLEEQVVDVVRGRHDALARRRDGRRQIGDG